MAHVYPDGPDPTETPAISSLLDPPFLTLYTYIAVVGAVICSWAGWRSLVGRRLLSSPQDAQQVMRVETGRPGGRRSKGTKGRDGIAIAIDNPDQQVAKIRCFRTSWLGELAFALFLSIALVLVAITLAVLYDKYWGCQLTGIDALCFYGSYPLSGSSVLNERAFFSQWVAYLVYLSVLLSLKGNLRNLFRLPCSAAAASFVSIHTTGRKVMLMKASSNVILWARRLKAVMSEIAGLTTSTVETVPVLKGSDGSRYIEFQARRYPIRASGGQEATEIIEAPSLIRTYGDILAMSGGISSTRAKELLKALGPNSIPYKPDSILQSLTKEFATPFWAYSLMVYLYWFWFGYIIVGVPLFLVVLTTGLLKISVTRKGQTTVAGLATDRASCSVLRDGAWVEVPNDQLVQGDVVKIIGDGWQLPCDLALLQGACVVNEAGLTGESIPVRKVEIPRQSSMLSDPYDPSGLGKRNTLFAGTVVLQADSTSGTASTMTSSAETLAVVTATAIQTSKGGILSAILYPIKLVFRYDEDLEIVLLILALYVAIVFAAVFLILTFNQQQTTLTLSFAYAVFTVSQVISPLLPIGMIAGHFFSVVRLSQQGLFCTNPARIAISGKTRVFCFDKTGTLTTESLEFICAQLIDTSEEAPKRGKVWFPVGSSRGLDRRLVHAMASCHSVSKLGDNLIGSQMEVKMVQAIEWDVVPQQNGSTLLVSSSENDSLVVIRRFEFSFERQSMAVIVRTQSGEAYVFVKGSFESVSEMTDPKTVPAGFPSIVSELGEEGFYLLAMAGKQLGDVTDAEIMAMDRFQAESDMHLLGLLAYRNELKEDTINAISDLKIGDVRPVMITGDNAQTGQFISRKSGMTVPGSLMLLAQLSPKGEVMWLGATSEDQSFLGFTPVPTQTLYTEEYYKRLEGGMLELAVSGNKAYAQLEASGDLPRLLMFIRIFARASPLTKSKIIQAIVDQGLVVGMCGDGGNDCGALRAAHAGVALSDSSASIVAPFTAKSRSCTAVIQLLKEGRCALHTNLATYRFLMIYGQLFGVWKVTGFAYGVLIPTACYLLVDVLAVVLLTFAMTCALPRKSLAPRRPTSSLFSAYTLASLLGCLFLGVVTFIVLQLLMIFDPGYLKWPAELSSTETFWLNGDNWESTFIFWPVFFFFSSSALVFGFGADFRQPVWTNWQLVLSWAALFILGSYLVLSGSNTVTQVFHMASEQFNYPGVQEDIPDSVWAEYQTQWELDNPGAILCFPDTENGEPCSPGLDFGRRLRLYITILAGLLLFAIWQAAVVDTSGRQARRWFPNSTPRPVFPL